MISNLLGNAKSPGPPEIEPRELIYDKNDKRSLLGEGSYGKVYRGFTRGLNVAIKVPKKQTLSPTELANMRKEVEVMKGIFHPNVVLFLGACTENNNLAIVTELMQTDLDSLLHDKQRGKPSSRNLPDPETLTLAQKLKMAKEAALGINWLHGICKIIHRDLKPANLLIRDLASLTIKITDFGFSETLKKVQVDVKGPKGTLLYMAPEVIRMEPFTEKADVYSFGLILWELLTLIEPFPEFSEPVPFVNAVTTQGLRPDIPPDCPPGLAALMRDCWDMDPARRPTMAEVCWRMDEVYTDVVLRDEGAKLFWKQSFMVPGQSIPEEVDADHFLQKLGEATRAPAVCQRLQHVVGLVPPGVQAENPKRMVTLEWFDMLIKWFGGFFTPGSDLVLGEIAHIANAVWFHGDITSAVAERRLRKRPDNTFLVRFSRTDPAREPFAISKNQGSSPSHKRISRLAAGDPSGNRWAVPVGDSVQRYPSLEALVADLRTRRNLGEECPPSELPINYGGDAYNAR